MPNGFSSPPSERPVPPCRSTSYLQRNRTATEPRFDSKPDRYGSERKPHAHVPSGDPAELVASDQREVRPEVPAAVQADESVGVEGTGAVGSDRADRGVAHVALQVDHRRRRPDHADLAADTVVVGVDVEIEAGDLHVL